MSLAFVIFFTWRLDFLVKVALLVCRIGQPPRPDKSFSNDSIKFNINICTKIFGFEFLNNYRRKVSPSRNLKTYGCLRLIILAWPACLLSCKYVKVEIAFIDYLFSFKNARNGHNGQPCALKGAFVTQQSVASDYEREVLHFYANITNSDSTAVIREIVRVSPKMPGSEKTALIYF